VANNPVAHDFYSLAQKHSFRVLLHPVLGKSGATVAGQQVKEAS
jgi:biopolymer transport protein ExbB